MTCWFKKRGKTSLYTIPWPFMNVVSISESSQNPPHEVLDEVMIQQMLFGWNLKKLPKKCPAFSIKSGRAESMSKFLN